jgi:hypothetical protein
MARAGLSEAAVVVDVDAAAEALGEGDSFDFVPCAEALTGTSSVSAATQVPVIR